jgi:hypothetical protein
MKRFYQWDGSLTAKELYRQYQVAQSEGRGKQYVLLAKQTLANAFQEVNLEITEAEFGSEGYGIKRLIPILGRCGIMISHRHAQSKKILYAQLLAGKKLDRYITQVLSNYTSEKVTPSWSLDKGTYAELIKRCIYETEVTHRIKKMGEILDYQASSDTIERLLMNGAQLT